MLQPQAIETALGFSGARSVRVGELLVNGACGTPGSSVFEDLSRIKPGTIKPELIAGPAL